MNEQMETKLRLSMDECLAGMDTLPSLEKRVLERIGGQRRAPVRLSFAMAAVLVLTLLTAAALAAGALAGWFRAEQKQTGAMRSCTSDGDTLYLLSGGGLYAWQPGQEEPLLLLDDTAMQEAGLSTEALLLMMGETPALLHPESCSLWLLQGRRLQPQGDYSGTALADDRLCITAAVCAGDHLLIRALPQDALPQQALLFRWHLPTGSVELLRLSGVLELCACDSEQVYVLRQESTDGDQPQYRLSLLEAATGTVTETLCTVPAQGIEHIMTHPKTGQIAAFVAGAPSLWSISGWMPLQGYAPSMHTNACAIVGDGIAAVSFNDLQVIPFADQNSMTTLRIRGFMATNNEDAAFQQAYPGIAVQREKDPSLNAAAIQQAIANGDSTDLFHLWLSPDLAALFQNDALAALSSSPLLERDAQTMLPVFRDGLGANNQIYAVPSAVFVQVWESTQDSPSDYAGLLEVCMDNGWTQEQYAEEWLKAYLLSCAPRMPDFRLPGVAEFLQTLREASPPEDVQMCKAAITTNVTLDLSGKPFSPPSHNLNDMPAANTTFSDPASRWRVPSPAVAGAKAVVPVRLSVYVLNPNAASPELALRYLEAMAAHRRPDTEALLKPDTAAPVLQPGVEQHIEQMTAEQRAYEAANGLAPNEEQLEARVAALKADPSSWAVTEENLSVYREEIVPWISLQLHPLLTRQAKGEDGAYTRMLQTVLAYMHGECTQEECLHRLDELVQTANPL